MAKTTEGRTIASRDDSLPQSVPAAGARQSAEMRPLEARRSRRRRLVLGLLRFFSFLRPLQPDSGEPKPLEDAFPRSVSRTARPRTHTDLQQGTARLNPPGEIDELNLRREVDGPDPRGAGSRQDSQGGINRPDSLGGNRRPDPLGGNRPDSLGGINRPDSLGGNRRPDSLGGNRPDSLGGINRPDSLGGNRRPDPLGAVDNAGSLESNPDDSVIGSDSTNVTRDAFLRKTAFGRTRQRHTTAPSTPVAIQGQEEAPVPPPVIEGYRELRCIGAGGAARVYEALEEETGRTVALKVLQVTAEENPIAARRLMREGTSVQHLNHPGTVAIYDSGTTATGHPYLVMERVSGQSLRERIEQRPMTAIEAWTTVRAAAEIVQAAHEAGILHRDITPGNVLLDKSGRIRLTDFGLARNATDFPLTRAGESLGTPPYMAPEQWWGASVDERTDVYGLGAILYECLSGKPPWSGQDAGEVLHQIATADAPPIRLLEVSIPPTVDDFLRKCLARSPTQRPQDVESFIQLGDETFAPAFDRLDSGIIISGSLMVLSSLLVGYAGSSNPVHWIREAGVVAYLLALLSLASLPTLFWQQARVIVPALLAAGGLLGASLGFHRTMSAVHDLQPEARFVIFHVGLKESLTNVYIGATIAAGMTMAFAWGKGPVRLPGRQTCFVMAAITLVGVMAGDPGSLWILLTAAALVARGSPRRNGEGLVASLATLLFVELAVATRQVAAAATIWAKTASRVDRIQALTELVSHNTPLLVAGVGALLVVLVFGAWRDLIRLPTRLLAWGLLAAAAPLLVLLLLSKNVSAERQPLYDALEPRFSLWSELEPPTGEGSHHAFIGLTLQLGRSYVTLNGEKVTSTESLKTDGNWGPGEVAHALAPKLELGEDRPDLILACDQTLPWSTVSQALKVARELGVRRLDILLEPNPPTKPFPVSTPREATLVLPRDLSAIEVELTKAGTTGAFEPPADMSFGEVASHLMQNGGQALGVP